MQLGNSSPQQLSLLCYFSAFQPCLAPGWSLPSAYAKQLSQSQSLGVLQVGAVEVLWAFVCQGPPRVAMSYCSVWESSRGKLLLSYLCTVTLERKLEVTVIAVSRPCSPGLGREMALVATAKPESPDPAALVGKLRGRDVGSCSILLYYQLVKFLGFCFCV